jgi:predicted KAP-like P-loop ATPase
MLLPDNETKIDLLNNEAIALTVIKLLRARPDHPVTIGIHGDWGAGKSSILEMVEAGLETDTKVLCLKFNGWRFQGFEDSKIALLEGIVEGLLAKKPKLTRTANSVKNIFRRIDWLKVAKKAGGLAVTAFSGVPLPDQINMACETIRNVAANPLDFITKGNLETILNECIGVLKPAEEIRSNVPSEVAEFQQAFRGLLDEAGVEQLIVLIDDLDRCLPDTAIETLEAIRLFVFTERTAFIVAADEAMIEYAVRRHFPDLPESTSSQTYARSYLEKLIQIPFRIPPLGQTETRIYVTLLLVGASLGETEGSFASLIAVAREKLKRPWLGDSLDYAAINNVLGTKTAKVREVLTLSEQIGPVLASGTQGNPRQIKRFLNTLLLRKSTADARGFGNEVKLPVLAKLMLAERFISHLFDQIGNAVVTAANGRCLDLLRLEQSLVVAPEPVRSKTGDTKLKKAPDESKQETIEESTILKGWRESVLICDWAKNPPLIGDEDLRPYLFIAKDRKDYFGAVSALGHLAEIAEKLRGPRSAVQTMEEDLKKIAASEVVQIFEIVRARIIASDDFATKPTGIDGMIALVKVHSSLQNQLLEFLEGLPCSKLGTWVCQGWSTILHDPEIKRRYDSLLARWEADGQQSLKAAIKAIKATKPLPAKGVKHGNV